MERLFIFTTLSMGHECLLVWITLSKHILHSSYSIIIAPHLLHHHLHHNSPNQHFTSLAFRMAPAIIDFSDIKTFVYKNSNGVKGLADTGLTSIPKQYIQPIEERMNMLYVVAGESIPVIDMSESCNLEVDNLICDAAEKWGFFQIINHGVPIEVLENVKEATHRFFGLPAEEKGKYSKENSPTNNVRYGTSFSPEVERSLEWKDWLSLFYTSEDEASSLWPQECK